MKKLSFLILAIFCAGIVNAQNVIRLTKLDAPLNVKMPSKDSLFIAEEDVIKFEELSSGTGTSVEYVAGNGEIVAQKVKEELNDSAFTAPTFSFTISFGSDTVDSIKVGNVNILYVPLNLATGQSSDSLAERIVAAINDSTATSGYKAIQTDSTVTISDVDSTEAANGTRVVVYTDATLNRTQGVLANGFARANIVTQLEKAFTVTLVGNSNEVYLEKSRVSELLPLNGGGTAIIYDRIRKYRYEVTNKRTTLQSTLNGL